MTFSKYLSTKPILSNVLAVGLPTEEQTWFLRACLWSGQQGHQAWKTWQYHVDDPVSFLKKDRSGCKGLLPLLFDSLRANGITPEKRFHTYLRTAYLRAEIRSNSYRNICSDVLSAFTKMGIVTAVLKGAALAETVYRRLALQHSHYLDILIKEDDFLSAKRLLLSLGFEPLNTGTNYNLQRIVVRHESLLPLVLQSNLFHIPFYNVAIEDMWKRSQTEIIAGVPTRLLSCADNLLHICGSALYSEPHDSLRWACDAWFLIDQHPDLDWNVLLESARRNRLALPLSVTLSYLKEKLNVPISISVIDGMSAIASQTDKVGREAALFGMRVSSRTGFKHLLQMADDWRSRAVIIKWIFFPSPTYLLWVQRNFSMWLLPFYYVFRPIRYVIRKLPRSLKNLIFRMDRERLNDSLCNEKVIQSSSKAK